MTSAEPTILIVDDEPDIADTYTVWLSDDYDVRTAYSGHDAIAQLDDEVDVVLLDRRMPDLSGDEVLSEIRNRDLTVQVAMVTAVEPDFDIIDMGFETYVVKPVLGDELRETIESLLARSTYDEQIQEYFSLASKRAVLEDEKGEDDLEGNDEYESLVGDLEAVRRELDGTIHRFDDEDYTAAFRDLSSDS